MDTQSRPTPPSPTSVPVTPPIPPPNYTPAATSAPTPPGGMLSRNQQIGIGVGVVLALVLGCGFLYWLSTLGALHVLRDLLIIFLAFESIVIFVLLAWLIIQVQSVVEYINTEVKPIINSVQESVTTVQTTTGFLRESVVDPIIKIQSGVAGLVQAARALTGRGDSSKRRF